jgi:hypothetical protein
MGVIQEINFTKDQENYSNDGGLLLLQKPPKIINFAYQSNQVIVNPFETSVITLFTYNPNHHSSINITFTASNPNEVEFNGNLIKYTSTLHHHHYLSIYNPSLFPSLTNPSAEFNISQTILTTEAPSPNPDGAFFLPSLNPPTPATLLSNNHTTGISRCDITIFNGTIIRGIATLM